jgi:tetratricopeptide (TPR) repeat protein
MPATLKKYFLSLLLLLFLRAGLFCQQPGFPVREWVKKLSVKKDPAQSHYISVRDSLVRYDSASIMHALRKLETYASGSNHYFNARCYALQANMHMIYVYPRQIDFLRTVLDKAMQEAYKTGDDLLVAQISAIYGLVMAICNEVERSITFYLKATELFERLGDKKSYTSISIDLGERLFYTRDYETCISNIKRGLENWTDTGGGADYTRIRLLNTIGQAWQQMNELDSALYYYEKSQQLVEKLNEETWRAINAGFMGQVYFLKGDYNRARQLMEFDYSINKKNEWNIAANTLQWLAKISLLQNKTDSALWQVREALRFLQKMDVTTMQQFTYLKNIYYTTAEVYLARRNTDSFYHYFRLYSRLNDSLQQVAIHSSMKLAQLKNENERNFMAVQAMQQEKEKEKLKRNFLIASIVLLSIIALLYLNRLRLNHRHREQMALQQEKTAIAEMQEAKEQLKLFTRHVAEKTAMIEQLQQEAEQKKLTLEQQQLMEQLFQLTILTEEDWKKFKSAFEKLHPGFFNRLKQKAPGITLAEQRMAALTRLQLSSREMASMLGISVDSVHKTRQRLRQRLQLNPEKNLEEEIANL